MVKKRVALVRQPDGLVTNCCVWDGIAPWNDLPADILDVECPAEVGPGWYYLDGEWTPPPEPPPEE